MSNDVLHEVGTEHAFLLRGITYLPHYHLKDMFVAPGGVQHHRSYFEAFGAEKIRLPLLPRSYGRNL